MRLLTFFGLIISIYSQGQAPVYTAVYRIEITSRPNFNFQKSETKTKKDSILQDISQQFFDELQKKNVTISVYDSVIVFNDSSIIHTVPFRSDANTEGILNITYNDSKSVLKNGKFYSIEKDKKIIEWENRYQFYKEINKSDTIFGYLTKVYVSLDETCHIWVCQKLSSLINPGIQILNPVGAILKYEIKEPDQNITSTLLSLIKKGK